MDIKKISAVVTEIENIKYDMDILNALDKSVNGEVHPKRIKVSVWDANQGEYTLLHSDINDKVSEENSYVHLLQICRDLIEEKENKLKQLVNKETNEK